MLKIYLIDTKNNLIQSLRYQIFNKETNFVDCFAIFYIFA